MDWNIITGYIINELFPRLTEILISPWLHRETLWMVIPLTVLLFFIEAYFGRNKTEQLGWEGAFANAVSLFWIAILLIKFLIESTPSAQLFYGQSLRGFVLIGVMFIWSLVLIISDYFHSLPKRFAYIISSPIPINVTAYIFIVLIIGSIPLDLTTILASITILILITIFFVLFRALFTPSESAKKTLMIKHKKALKKRELKKEIREEKIKEAKEKLISFIKKE